MIGALCMTGIYGFIGFLKSAVFVTRVYSGRESISRTFNTRRRKKLSRTNGKRRWRSKKSSNRKKFKISSTCC